MKPDLIVRGRQVVLPSGVAEAAIHIRGGLIDAVADFDDVPAGVERIDAGGCIVMPGLVDPHVHLNDPGREHWEGFVTGTRAAAAGGVTTLVDMPLNSIPATTSIDGLVAKLAAAEGNCSVDVGLWGGVVPGNAGDLEPLLREGVLGFKCFLVHSGVDEFPHVGEGDLRLALPVLARNGAVLLAHAEVPGPIDAARPQGSPREYATYLASRPRAAENEAIELLLRLSGEFGAKIHVVHLSSSDAVPMLEAARAQGLPVSVETCPHYLLFASETIGAGATEFKCAPPIRESENRELLWKALERGVIDFLATDHSPCPPEMKGQAAGNFFQAWGGIASLQFGLSAIWTEAHRRGFGIADVVRWMCSSPARLAGLAGRKGELAAGADADIVLFDAQAAYDWSRPVLHRHPITPYRGMPLRGVVQRTILRGKTVYRDREIAGSPQGTILRGGLWRLNAAPASTAEADLLRCCGSKQWAGKMAASRPFASLDAALEAGERIAGTLSQADWREAFAAHPRIGERKGSAWSKQEQSGMTVATGQTQREIAELNDRYFERFGFIFIVCATGLSAEDMLSQLRERVEKTAAEELAAAAREQRKITQLRLRKLIAP